MISATNEASLSRILKTVVWPCAYVTGRAYDTVANM
jgi:hypothetical protein